MVNITVFFVFDALLSKCFLCFGDVTFSVLRRLFLISVGVIYSTVGRSISLLSRNTSVVRGRVTRC